MTVINKNIYLVQRTTDTPEQNPIPENIAQTIYLDVADTDALSQFNFDVTQDFHTFIGTVTGLTDAYYTIGNSGVVGNLVTLYPNIYKRSLISANLYLPGVLISGYEPSVSGQINFSTDSDTVSYVDLVAKDFTTNTVTGLLDTYNVLDVTSVLSGLNYSSSWTTGVPLQIGMIPVFGNTGLLALNFSDSYLSFSYNTVEPFAPRNVQVEAGYKSVDISWDPPVDDGGDPILEYVVEYAIQTNFAYSDFTVGATVTDTSATVNNLVNGTDYVFRVAARNAVGLGAYSDFSDVVAPDVSAAPRASNTFNDANYTRIRLRRDTASNWSGVNPILGLGEPGYETDTSLLKIGDNNTTWNELDYVKVDNDSIVFPDDRDVYLTIGDSEINEDSPRISLNLSDSEKLNIVANNGIDLEYNPGFNSLVFSLDSVFNPFNSGELHSPFSRGRPGSVNYDNEYIYICTDINSWKRVPIETKLWFDPDSIAISLNSGDYPSITEIYFSGFNAIVTSDGDPFPAKASTNLANDGTTARSDFFQAYQIQDQNYNFSFRYRGGKNTSSSEIATSGYNGIFSNGVLFSAPQAGLEAVGIYSPPEGLHYNRTHFGTFFKVDDCGGYVNFAREYAYYDGRFLTRCWDDPLVYNNNPYYSGSNYEGDHFRYADGHSKILGFCFDGYPIYGPFGYTDSETADSGVTLMTSSYVTKSTDDHRPTGWKYTNAISVNDINYNLTAGAFIEDFEYAEGSGLLDQYNGRYAVTPEYPDGTYAYYLTFTSSGLLIPKYPYIIGNYSKERKVKQDLVPSLNPITVDGYFPLFTSAEAAENYGLLNGGDGTYTQYTIFGEIYYMPNGVANINIPAAPTDITLSENRISEKATIDAVIGVFTTTDENIDDTHTYSLVSGDGSDDNDNFSIYNNELRVNSILSYGVQDSHAIRVRSTDQTDRFFEKQFTVSVLEGTTFTSLSIVSGTSLLIAGSGHVFGSETQGTASDITYTWSMIGSPYASGVDFDNSYFEVNTTNLPERNDETVNIFLTAKSISAFNTLSDTTSFTLDHSEEPVCVAGYYPLYSSQHDAERDPNGDGTAHMHTVLGVIYWMPNGLSEFYHGTFDCDSL